MAREVSGFARSQEPNVYDPCQATTTCDGAQASVSRIERAPFSQHATSVLHLLAFGAMSAPILGASGLEAYLDVDVNVN